MSNYAKLQNNKFQKETARREKACNLLRKHLMAGEKIVEIFSWMHKFDIKVLTTTGSYDNYEVYDDGRVVYVTGKVEAVA